MSDNSSQSKMSMYLVVAVVVVAIFAGIVYHQRDKKDKKEGFLLGVHLAPSISTTQVARKLTHAGFDGKIVSNANYQSIPAARFGNVNFAANLKYALPDKANMAFDKDAPMIPAMEKFEQPKTASQFANLVKEGYCGQASSAPSQGQGSMMMAQLNKDAEKNPVKLMSDTTVGKGMDTLDIYGNPAQVYTVDRLMYSTSKGRYRRANTDYIRGDLAITPCNQGWFYSAGAPAVDLNKGALQALGGFDLGSAKETMALVHKYSGNTTQTGAGGPVDRQQNLALSSLAGSDIAVKTTAGATIPSYSVQATAFP
jgi:hypothetical protein